MVAPKEGSLSILQGSTSFWLLSLLMSASMCHALIHSGAKYADRSRVAGGGATAARIADAAGLPVVGASRRFLCDDNSTTNASESSGGSNRKSTSIGHDAVRNHRDQGNTSGATGSGKGLSDRGDVESNGERVGNGADTGQNNKGAHHDSSRSDGGEERNENEGREKSYEEKDKDKREKRKTNGKSGNNNGKEGGTVGNAAKGGGNVEESKSTESFDGGDSSKEGENHMKCNDSNGNSSEESSTTHGSSGSGADVSLGDRLGGWSGAAGGNEKLPSSLAALLADALIRLTASARIRIDGQGLDLGRRAGQQGSSPNPISTSGHSPARSSDQVLAKPLMAVNLFVFNEPIEISAVHSFENKGSVSLQTQLALTTALARDNATAAATGNAQGAALGPAPVDAASSAAQGAARKPTAELDEARLLEASVPVPESAVTWSRADLAAASRTVDSESNSLKRRELSEAHELLGDPPEVHTGSSPVHVSNSPVHVSGGKQRKVAVVAAVDEETRRGMEAWMQDEVKRAVSRELKQLRQKLLEDVDKRVRKLQQGSRKKRSGSRGKGGSDCKKRSKCGKSHKSKKSKEHYSDSSLWKPSLLAHKPFPSSINIRSYVFQGPVEISGIRELNNSGTITRQTQIAVTKATAKDNGTVSQNEPQSQRSAHGAGGMEGHSMGSSGGSSHLEERMTGGTHGDEKSHYQNQHGEGSGGGEKHGRVGEVNKHGGVGNVGDVDNVSGCGSGNCTESCGADCGGDGGGGNRYNNINIDNNGNRYINESTYNNGNSYSNVSIDNSRNRFINGSIDNSGSSYSNVTISGNNSYSNVTISGNTSYRNASIYSDNNSNSSGYNNTSGSYYGDNAGATVTPGAGMGGD
ncbi:unnamed protein product [Closterium sp. Yama58-4]|nr:unnamed protein product [Closterium sp. Yama58-4]